MYAFLHGFLRIVSRWARDSGASLRQETSRKSFLSGMGQWCIIAAGNYSRIVSYSTWDNGKSSWQETISEWFLIRHGVIAYHSDRKLLAYGFLFDVGQRGFIATGNCLRMVSYSTWDKGDSSRQETVCEWFPTRRGTKGIHSDRKLFAMVSYSAWGDGIS